MTRPSLPASRVRYRAAAWCVCSASVALAGCGSTKTIVRTVTRTRTVTVSRSPGAGAATTAASNGSSSAQIVRGRAGAAVSATFNGEYHLAVEVVSSGQLPASDVEGSLPAGEKYYDVIFRVRNLSRSQSYTDTVDDAASLIDSQTKTYSPTASSDQSGKCAATDTIDLLPVSFTTDCAVFTVLDTSVPKDFVWEPNLSGQQIVIALGH